MYNNSVPTASVYGTWSEQVEVWDVETDALMDLTSVVEITLLLIDPYTQFREMILTMSGGSIVIPSQGIIQWRVESDDMGTLVPKLYKMVLILEDADDKVPIMLGPVSIVE